MKETKYLDNEEQELIESLEGGNWKSAWDIEGWKTLLSRTAANTLTKDQRMNIRITKNDLDGINPFVFSLARSCPYKHGRDLAPFVNKNYGKKTPAPPAVQAVPQAS